MNAFRLSSAALLAASLLGLGLWLGASSSGCGTETYVWECYSPDGGVIGSYVTGVQPAPLGPTCPCVNVPIDVSGPRFQGDCAWLDAGTGLDGGAEGGPIPSCNGQCLPAAPIGWSGPLLLWFGAEVDAPACPESAPTIGYEGYAGLTTDPLACGACSCGAPSGSCGLPASITASAAPCTDAGTSTPFGGPTGWDGGCTSFDAPPAGALSATSTPLTLTEGCAPAQAPVQQVDPSLWSTLGLGCTPDVAGACPDPGEICGAPAVSGFRECVFFLGGEVLCPSGTFSPFTEQHVFYDDEDDTRVCSPCGCAAPVGSTCSALLSLYTDSACGGPAFASETLTDTTGGCLNVPPSFELSSKSIGPATYTGGTCQPTGGAASGSLTPVGPSTFCCIPSQ